MLKSNKPLISRILKTVVISAAATFLFNYLISGAFINKFDNYISPSSKNAVFTSTSTSIEQCTPSISEKLSNTSSLHNKTVSDIYSYPKDLNQLNQKFYFRQLSNSNKKIYQFVYEKILLFDKNIQLPSPIPINTVTKIMYWLRYDCPELFYISQDYTYEENDKGIILIRPKYQISEETYQSEKKAVDIKATTILQQVKGKSDYAAEKEIHDEICKGASYQATGTNVSNMFGNLVLGKSNCEGYSSSFTFLLRKIGIDAAQVIGSANGVGHSWNYVNINHTPTYCDVGWDDTNTPIYSFFNVPYSKMSLSRNFDYENILGALPKTESYSQNEYYRTGAFIAKGKDGTSKIKNLIQLFNENKIPSINIMCEDELTYQTNQPIFNTLISTVQKKIKIEIVNGSLTFSATA